MINSTINNVTEVNISDLLIIVNENKLLDKYISDLIPIAWYFANIDPIHEFINFNLNELDNKCIKITHNPHADIILPFTRINLTIEISNQNYCNINLNGPCSIYQIKNYVGKYSSHYKCNVLKCDKSNSEITIIFYK